MLAQVDNTVNNNIENSRLQSVVLEYKKTKKLQKAATTAIAVILILILIFSLVGWNFLNTAESLGGLDAETIAAMNKFLDSSDFEWPYIGENGNWFVNGKDTGISAAGTAGQTPHIGENGNWWIGNTDTGITAQGTQGLQGPEGSVPYIGANGNWWINGTDTGVSAAGQKGPQGSNGANGQNGKDGKDGLTPYIGTNGNWWIGDKDLGVPATGNGNNSGDPGTQPPQSSEGNFTVSIDQQQGKKGLAISESRGFANPVQELSTTGLKNAWNICYTDIPDGLDSDVGGAKNGQNYFAYTFFLKNVGTETLSYNEMLTLTDNKLDAVKAARFTFYRDGKPITYASPAKDGSLEPHACDQPFMGDVHLLDLNYSGLEPGQVVRYTVIVWFEGDDPECVDAILGGSVKLSLGFKVI